MINEDDIKDMWEENKENQPKPADPPPPEPWVQLHLDLQITNDEETLALLATIPFGR
jgi:hypothetical protein